jgi:hypothetical protein
MTRTPVAAFTPTGNFAHLAYEVDGASPTTTACGRAAPRLVVLGTDLRAVNCHRCRKLLG